MTTVDQARELVLDHWKTQWGTRTPYVFENEKLTEPTPPVVWVRLSVRNMLGYQHSLGGIGNRLYHREGKVLLQVMAPVNKGMKDGSTVAHDARALFEGVRLGDIVFYGGTVKEAKPDGKWYVTLATIDFRYTEVK